MLSFPTATGSVTWSSFDGPYSSWTREAYSFAGCGRDSGCLSNGEQHLNSNEKCLTRFRVRHSFFGADEANRTPDLLITNQLLYQLSYISEAAYFTNKLNAAVSAKADFAWIGVLV